MKLFVSSNKPLASVVLGLMRDVHALIKEMKLGYFVCGAAARDILLLHVYGIETGIATLDVDFGVAVENWEQFEGIKAGLIKTARFCACKEGRAAALLQRGKQRSRLSGRHYSIWKSRGPSSFDCMAARSK